MNRLYSVEHPTDFGTVKITYPTLEEAQQAKEYLEGEGYVVEINEIRV